MTTRETKALERDAIDAHAAGLSWSQFWQAHAEAIRALEPWDRLAYRRLVRKLLALVSAGDTDGMDPVGDGLDMPWEADDSPKPDDVGTVARLQLQFPLAQEFTR